MMSEISIVDVGVEQFNSDHNRLLFYVMEFTRLAKRFKQRSPFEDEWDQIRGIFPRLQKYTEDHFKSEEDLMREQSYPLIESHQKQHHHLSQCLSDLKAGIDAQERQYIAQLESFLVDWLCNHINKEDFKYRGFFQGVKTKKIIDTALFNEMISASQLYEIVLAEVEDAIILDIRTTTEQQEGIIPGSTLYPCDHNLENRQDTGPFNRCFSSHFRRDQFDETKRYFLVCRSGPRTEIALEAFLENQLMACELIGGLEEWKRQRFPLAHITDKTPRLR
ncbi:MAG: bacteriohemerythrin [Magnetococcales bacterium]|nr:bacteriohemerythrin [Magnetococcales bacterium]